VLIRLEDLADHTLGILLDLELHLVVLEVHFPHLEDVLRAQHVRLRVKPVLVHHHGVLLVPSHRVSDLLVREIPYLLSLLTAEGSRLLVKHLRLDIGLRPVVKIIPEDGGVLSSTCGVGQ
jgi:hypothetical protein